MIISRRALFSAPRSAVMTAEMRVGDRYVILPMSRTFFVECRGEVQLPEGVRVVSVQQEFSRAVVNYLLAHPSFPETPPMGEYLKMSYEVLWEHFGKSAPVVQG